MIRLVMVDDHELFLGGLKGIFEATKDIKTVGTAHNGDDGLRLVMDQSPDVVLMDMTMTGTGGVECTRRVMTTRPNTRVLALSMHNNLQLIAGVLRLGACGYLLKDCTTQELLFAVRTVAAGGVFLSSPVVELVIKDYLRLLDVAHQAVRSPLSSRERGVLDMLVQGLNSKQIGERLSISKNTVDTHRRRIMDKLDCNSVAELIRYAIREGLIDLS